MPNRMTLQYTGRPKPARARADTLKKACVKGRTSGTNDLALFVNRLGVAFHSVRKS